MILVSYNGINFVDYDGTGYDVWIGDGSGHALPSVQAQLSPRIGAWPVLSGLARPGRRFTMFVYILGDDIPALRTAMFQLFNPEDETPKRLVMTDDDGGRARYLMCLCEALQPAKDGGGYSERLFVATMVVDGDVRWRSVSTETVVWPVTVDGDTVTVSNPGDDEAYPVLTIEPTAPNSFRSSMVGLWTAMQWKAPVGATSYPIQLGPLDTASLVNTATATTLNGAILAGDTTITLTDASSFDAAGMAYITDAVAGDEQIAWTGKTGNDLTGVTRGIGGTSAAGHSGGQAIAVSTILANGNDLRVWVDGIEDHNRWLVDFDTANTYVWINADFQQAVSLTLNTSIGAGDTISTLVVNEDIGALPTGGILLIGTEAFTYTGKSNANKQFTGVTRATKGTVAGDHLSSADVLWIQHDVWLTYNDPTASAPSTDDNYKPIFNLDSSDNDEWVYEYFGEDDGLRPGSWDVNTTGDAVSYTGNRTSDADPWEEIGGTAATVNTSVRWFIYNPCRIVNANFTNGEKRSSNIADWGVGVRIENSENGTSWAIEYSIPAPSSNNTWESWSRNEAIASGKYYVSLRVHAALGTSVVNNLEAADCTITLNSSYTPEISFPGSVGTSTYPLEVTIINDTTSESVAVQYNMDLNESLQVDTHMKTVTDLIDGSNQRQALTVVNGPRRHWLKLEPGDNELEWTEIGVTGVTVTIDFEARYYD